MSVLEGLTVVSVEQAVAAPYASWRLAEAGARVIKVERPEGDFARHYDALVHGQSSYFVWLNRGKQSVCLDLSLAADRELLGEMIADADVFLQNLKPGAMEKFALGSATLRERDPRLITCDIRGFDGDGPRAHLKAYDLIVQAEAGLCAITGNEAGPARVGISVVDIATGAAAYTAILEAVLRQRATGEGEAIEISLFDSIADWMNVPILQYRYGGHIVGRSGVAHPTIAPYGAYRCADGKQIVLSIQNEREWVRFCETVLALPGLHADARFASNTLRVSHRDALEHIVSGIFEALDCETIERRLSAADIAHGRVNTIEEAASHPDLNFETVTTPMGDVRVVAPAGRSKAARFPQRAVPALGEHTDLVRSEYRRAGQTHEGATI